jgi:adenosylcobinamide-phosphate synthase
VIAPLAAGYAADLLLGDPARGHPVAGFGRLAQTLERAVYAPTRARGAAYAAVLVGAAVLAAEALARSPLRRRPTLAALTYTALGGRSLNRAAARVADALDRGDLEHARATLPTLAGRDPHQLDAPAICRAVVESVAENTTDAVVGVLFWGAVAGPAGVAAYRAANTLDAMVGHRSPRYAEFGWAAARLDDALSWPPARLTAAATVVCAPLVGGSPRQTWKTLRRDGKAHPSPNAGRAEAAFAGALDVTLGGPLSYGGRPERRPTLGDGAAPTTADIRRANRLAAAVGVAILALTR